MRSLGAALLLTGALAAVLAQSGKPLKSATKASLTGCVDEREGQYVLTDDKNLQPTARLQPAAGTPEDNFARHMGHKVTVRGKILKEDPLPVITVEHLDTVSETCASGTPQQ
ncbi:MAG TPA: hypothetical protein VKR61_23550 [Bryobacteraceae bacterium]|nr:hypothetical protein [Bryobacteraceae bacterium]